ncbi:hypothetical protein AZE42_06575 [Rhizopogon vesiculosus]|uniref:Uncharacterized protein n=1 Tax=Rhizopogon vesiculosus TaxID=180088 RepID=A0A1J8QXF6_9AGAM|nr:hypothetical protein AZE42_06575 [Rhizopogon vesiculosus]
MSLWSWNSKPTSHAQRKFIELIYNRTGKYANWDPPSEMQVGSYGRIDRETGNLTVEGSIYDKAFEENLIGAGINIDSDEHRPEECPDETDFTAWSKNVKKLEFNIETHAKDIPGIASATIKGTWEVKKGTTGAVLLMHNPRIKRLTADVLTKLSKIELLKHMHVVTKVFYCPAFSLYLSDKSGEKISMALVDATSTAGGSASMAWWSDNLAGLSRRGCKLEHCFTPLYELKHVRHPRWRRTSPSPERKGEDLWITPHPPWAPLDEEGNDVPVYVASDDSSDEESGSE